MTIRYALAAYRDLLVAKLDLDSEAACVRMADADAAKRLGLPSPDRRTGDERRAYRAAVRVEADRRRAGRRASDR